jgi:hypothetical protein
MGSAGHIDGLAGFFFVFLLINRGGHFNRLGKDLLTVTFEPRRLECLPRLIVFARLGKDLCSSVYPLDALPNIV